METYIRQADKIYQLTYEDGTLIETTWSHPFYIEGKGWVKAENLQAGDVSKTAEGSLTITKVHVDPRSEEVYNFHVSKVNTYMVSDRAIVVHNRNPNYGCMDAWCLYGMLVQPFKPTKDQIVSALRSIGEPGKDPLSKMSFVSCFMPGGFVCTGADITADLIEGNNQDAGIKVAISSVATLITLPIGGGGGRAISQIAPKTIAKMPLGELVDVYKNLKKVNPKVLTQQQKGVYNQMKGLIFEAGALRHLDKLSYGTAKTDPILTSRGYVRVVPDFLDDTLGEIKNVRYQTYSKQIEAQILEAAKHGVPYHLIVSPTTRVSEKLRSAIKQNRGEIRVFDMEKNTLSPY